MLFCVLFFNFYSIQAKDYPLEPINKFDEVTVEITVKGYFRFEANVLITDTHAVYVNVEQLFKNLGISCRSENEGNTIKGFIEQENKRYQIDFDSKQINSSNSTIKSIHGIVKEFGAIYVEMNIMNEAFGLNMLFNFRSLSIKLQADFELPMIKQVRLEKMRQNLSNLYSKNETVIDTVVGRNYHLFKGGTMDWSLSSYQSQGARSKNGFSLRLGSELLYGEAKIGFTYNNQSNFDKRQLYYNWRWVANDNNYIKQAQFGKIGASTIAFLGAPLVGVSFNNSPITLRKAKGTYTISEYTEPNWTVELYINDALVDYTEADASGLYVFNIPIVYGYNKVTLKLYGPLGEERIEERKMNTPYTFMPVKVMEYNVSGGILENENRSQFGRGELNYGVNRFVTIGGGLEYLSSIPDTPFIPFANVAFQPFSKMVINMNYSHNVSIKGMLSYSFGKSGYIEFDYSKYVEGQQATHNNTSEERKIRLSLPFIISKIRGNTKLSYNQQVYGSFTSKQLNAVFSGRYKNFSANASLSSNWNSYRKPFMTSTVAFSHRMRSGFTIRPTFYYDISGNKIKSFRAEIEKRVAKLSYAVSYERNVHYGTNNASFSFKYELPYGRIGFYSSYKNRQYNFSENAQGSVAFGVDNGKVKTGYNSAIGKGGVLLYPFLDMNQNGRRDKGEQMVLLNNVRVSGGKAVISKQDSIVRVSDLNAFINYKVRFSDGDLDNISLQFKHKTYQVLVDPNQYKKVYVPILVMGEVSGMVLLNNESAVKGQGRIRMQIRDKKGHLVAETLSESDGYFSYLGLKPGEYSISIDEKQLKKIAYQAAPLLHKIELKTLVDGDIIGGIDFEIQKAKEASVNNDIPTNVNPLNNPVIEGKELKREVAPTTDKKTNIEKKYYSLELGVFINKLTSKEILKLTPIFYKELPNGSTRYIFGKFANLQEVVSAKKNLLLRGIKGFSVGEYAQEDLYTLTPDFNTNAKKEKTIYKTINLASVNANFVEIPDIAASFYSVQIGVFNKKVTLEQLLNITPIYYEVLPDKTTRYISGKYTTKKEAKQAENKIVALGIKDAYIVAYKNGKKVDVATLDRLKTSTKIKKWIH